MSDYDFNVIKCMGPNHVVWLYIVGGYFRVIARDSMSPSFQYFLSGPPYFSSACAPQKGLAPSTPLVCCAPFSLPSALRWSPAASCGQPGGVVTHSSLTHSEQCWSTSCWASPWPAASTGSSLPAGIHGLVGEADIVSVYSALCSQPSLTCSPSPLPCFYFCDTQKRKDRLGTHIRQNQFCE